MARKKSTTSAVSDKPTCPECGGRKWSRGFKHAKGCSMAFVPNKPKSGKKSGKRAGRPKGSKNKAGGGYVGNLKALAGNEGRNGGKIDLRVLRGMGAEALLDLKHRVDTLLKSKVGEIKEKMSMFERMLLSISGKSK